MRPAGPKAEAWRVPRFAANLSWLFAERPFAARFAAAAAQGFDAVECLFPYAIDACRCAALLRETALTLELFNLPAGDWAAGERGLAALPGREAQFDAGLEEARRYAAVCGTRRLHAMAGIPPAGSDPDRVHDCLAENLRRAARSLAEDGCTLLVEPINSRDMPGYAISTLEDAAAIVARVGEPNLRVQADLYHLQIMGGDVIRRIVAALPVIGHVQIAGVPDRNEPDLGELRHEAVFAALDDHGYNGWVGCEYMPSGRTEAGLGWARPWLSRGPRSSM